MSAFANVLDVNFARQTAPIRPKPAQGLNDSYLAAVSVADQNMTIPRKAPQREGISIEIATVHAAFEQGRATLATEIASLQTLYLFADSEVNNFLRQSGTLRATLRQAIDPLRTSFGADKLFNLEISRDEDGFETMYVVAIWQADAPAATGALHHFLETWWLQRMSAGNSDLAFAYKLV
jgi:hypothetical protein